MPISYSSKVSSTRTGIEPRLNPVQLTHLFQIISQLQRPERKLNGTEPGFTEGIGNFHSVIIVPASKTREKQ